jgi:hypothetical protein
MKTKEAKVGWPHRFWYKLRRLASLGSHLLKFLFLLGDEGMETCVAIEHVHCVDQCTGTRSGDIDRRRLGTEQGWSIQSDPTPRDGPQERHNLQTLD